ncbi:hypothetical protein GCM10007893_07270 [Paracoccus marinus]|nr:hypothetical protein GCM10007893_07270 [Paracoccus marinus]
MTGDAHERIAAGAERKTFQGESAEQKALRALAWMAEQYLGRDEGALDNLAMSSGELALEVLAEHGLVTWLHGGVRFASWTDAGQRLLDRYE